jgi:hypothetical protein
MFAVIIGFAVVIIDNYEKLYLKLHPKNQRVAYWRSPTFWRRVLSRNLLAFSDTQLLTGLAIQFTALLKHCELSIYHFQIVTELAFLTTVVHLLCLIALRDYFVANKWSNLPRVTVIIGNLVMQGYTSYVSYSYGLAGLNVSAHLACFYKGHPPPVSRVFHGPWAALLIGGLGGHCTIILAMYFRSDRLYEKYKSVVVIGRFVRTWIVAPAYSIYVGL